VDERGEQVLKRFRPEEEESHPQKGARSASGEGYARVGILWRGD